MSVLSCQYLTLTRNAILHYSWRDLAASSCCFTCRDLHSNSNSAVPVKLAYASYESMMESNSDPKLPVIIMHGLFGSKTNWNSLSKAIHQQTDRKVIAIDARNHGDSPHSPNMSYEYMAQDVVKLMNDLGFEKSVMIGHSMGGSAMMYVALNYPELVEKLIVVDMSPVRTSPSLAEMKNIFKALRSISFDGSPTLTKARRRIEEQLVGTVKPLPLRQFLSMNLVEADIGQYRWRVNLPVLEESFATKIATFPQVKSKTYKGPTLFIGGALSDYIKVNDHPKIKKLFPSATFLYIKDANHWVHADKPAEFLNIAVNFINRVDTE